MQTTQETDRLNFARFVALLRGTPRATAMRDLSVDADSAWLAELLLRGDERGRHAFDPRRVGRALRFAQDVGLTTV
jgi:hypothetical protein